MAKDCIAVKTFGVEALSKESISELIIFAKDKRYDVSFAAAGKSVSMAVHTPLTGYLLPLRETKSKLGRSKGQVKTVP
jgi:hypothetical protein